MENEHDKLNEMKFIMKQINELKKEDPAKLLDLMNLWLEEKPPE